jgi:hypothetical protein
LLREDKSSEADFPETRSPDCPECERLWKIYVLATRQHLDATVAKETTWQTDGIEKMKTLEHQAVEAGQWRMLARKAVKDHAAEHAGDEPRTQD